MMRDFLQDRPSFEAAIALPRQFGRLRAYPAAYCVTYNGETGGTSYLLRWRVCLISLGGRGGRKVKE